MVNKCTSTPRRVEPKGFDVGKRIVKKLLFKPDFKKRKIRILSISPGKHQATLDC